MPASASARRVLVDPEGPVLVEGPVEVVLDDGSTVRSDRVMVAVCACGRSGRYPWCDTSHRRPARTRDGCTGDGSTRGGPTGDGSARGGYIRDVRPADG
ncbi:CDGSH iron-sulfur domain-containing protein [Streptomyces sp. NPDC005962]|uniref:CDGSH iron-sulfur domain-containing protein n=1 Tax=Streptomyces sp. NPDC005962 TaxID=3154466 RepID=UPI0033E408F2